MDPMAVRTWIGKFVNETIGAREAEHQSDVARVATATVKPLNLLVDGDSWFDYPLDGSVFGVATDTISQLRKLGTPRPTILNLAHYGNTSEQELGYQRQQRIIQAIANPANGIFDAILISGGGNDVAGDSLCIWLHDAASVGYDVDQAINLDRFNACVDFVRAAYLDLIDLRNRYLPQAPIFTHGYDFPPVSGVGVCNLGPWLKPSLLYCGWSGDNAEKIIRTMMASFDSMLIDLASDIDNNMVHVATQGTLPSNEWANELHPTPVGFGLIAKKFEAALAARFPGRI